ncbi:MAG: hypothetical protein ACI4ES_07755 [Roseburia sp.]
MRKEGMVAIIILFAMLLGACGKENLAGMENPLEVTENIEAQNGWSLWQNYGSTESGYYIFDENTDLVMFWDAETKEYVPLCNKPECAHDDENCNAYFSSEEYKPGVMKCYGTSLYLEAIKEDGIYLEQVSADGATRKTLCRLTENKEENIGNIILHHGAAYYEIETLDVTNGNEAYVYKILLEEDAKPEVVDSFSGIGATFSGIYGYENKIYLLHTWISEEYEVETAEGMNSGLFHELYSYDIETGEKQLLSQENIISYDVDTKAGKIYYCLVGGNVYQMDLDGKNVKLVYDTEGAFPMGTIRVTDGYIYLDNWLSKLNALEEENKLYVLSSEGTLIKEIEKKTDAYYQLALGDDNYIFTTDGKNTYYIDKKAMLEDRGSIYSKWGTVGKEETSE